MPQSEQFPPSYPNQRRYRRFDLELPVSLRVPSEEKVLEFAAVSKNVSARGFLLKTHDRIPPRTRVTLTMEVLGPRSRRPIRLLGEGEVVRVEALEPGAGFAIAIDCKESITEISGPSSA